jgi:hypothetical protein
MATKTTHVIPSDDGWVIKKERTPVFVAKKGNQLVVKGRSAERASAVRSTGAKAIGQFRALTGRGKVHVHGVFPTQQEAIDAARKIVQHSSAGQIVVHGRDGSMRWQDVHGLPLVQTPPRKSAIGTKAIEKAVSTVIRERLERE